MENSDSDLARVLAKYERLVDWERQDRSAMKVDLAPLRDLLDQLNNPQKTFRTIHIAGTEGKRIGGRLD
jgi:folylpolyglutamate synthase/dihydropteroate synthase